MPRWKVTVSRTIGQRSEMLVTTGTPRLAMDRALEYAKGGVGWYNVGPALTGPSPAVVPIEKVPDTAIKLDSHNFSE